MNKARPIASDGRASSGMSKMVVIKNGAVPLRRKRVGRGKIWNRIVFNPINFRMFAAAGVDYV